MNKRDANPCSGTYTTQEAFRARMEDQCQQIRRYRMRVMQREHRWLTVDEAAGEWIAQFAAAYAEREGAPVA